MVKGGKEDTRDYHALVNTQCLAGILGRPVKGDTGRLKNDAAYSDFRRRDTVAI